MANRRGEILQLLLYFYEAITSSIEPRAQLVRVTQFLEHPLRLACELRLCDVVHILCEDFKRIFLELPKTEIPLALQKSASSIETNPFRIDSTFIMITGSTSPFPVPVDMSF